MTNLSNNYLRIFLLVLCLSLLIVGYYVVFRKSQKNKQLDISLSSAASIYEASGFSVTKEHSCEVDHSVKFASRSVCGTNLDIEEVLSSDPEQEFQTLLNTSLELKDFTGLEELVSNKEILPNRIHTHAQVVEQKSGKQCSMNIGTTSNDPTENTKLYLSIFCAD